LAWTDFLEDGERARLASHPPDGATPFFRFQTASGGGSRDSSSVRESGGRNAIDVTFLDTYMLHTFMNVEAEKLVEQPRENAADSPDARSARIHSGRDVASYGNEHTKA
jgi:hypothetical protein